MIKKIKYSEAAGKIIIVSLFLFTFIYILVSCNTTEPPPPPPPEVSDTATVTVIDQTHRSLTVNIKTTGHNPNWQIKLWRSFNNTDTLVAGYNVAVTDTTIINDNNGSGLMLDTEYGYYTVIYDTTGTVKDSAETVTGTTLAPTSHDYTWQEFTIGEWQSALYDVWGTDENNVYAVGTVMINDTAYGVLHWNGIEWKPSKRIGGVSAIFGFNENDIWVVGGAVEHYDGTRWERKDALPTSPVTVLDQVLFENNPYTCLWGTSSSNLYLGSHWGKIVHWDGEIGEIVFERQDETLGSMDGTNAEYIIAVGTDFIPPSLTVFYDGNNWSEIHGIENNYSINSVSIVNKGRIYFGGEGIFLLKNGEFERIRNAGYYVSDVKYNHKTGVTVAVGSFDEIDINNGVEWKSYKGSASIDRTLYQKIFLVDQNIFIVGTDYNYNSAKIIIGINN